MLDPILPGVHKMVKHTLNVLQYLLQDFKRVFDHVVDTWRYEIKVLGFRKSYQPPYQISRHLSPNFSLF